jgi:hypothetical protein
LTTSRTVGIAARNNATFPVVLFLQARTRATLALDTPSLLLDVDIVPYGAVTLTTYSGSTRLQRQTFTTAAVAHFTAAAANPITHLRFDTVGLSTIDHTPPDENDGIVYGGATASPAPLQDCVTLVEEVVIALLWPPPCGPGAPVKVLISRLRECSGKSGCAAEVRRFAAAATAFEATANIIVRGNTRCQAFRAVALAAEALTACILNDGSSGCTQLAANALAAEIRALEAALRFACTPSAAAAAEFRSLLVTARPDRALFEICGTTKSDENSMPLAIGDPSDISLWLAQIPELSASTATTAGCEVRQICWLTPDEAAYSALVIQAEETFQSIVEQSSVDVPLFVPHSQYRLTVTTGQENSSVSGSPQSWTHQLYFQTAGPPGDYIQGDPLDNLNLYVGTSIPADGSAGVYANYGVGVIYNQSYVDGMYAGLGEDLVLHLIGADGQQVKDSNGNPVVFANPWSTATSTTLQTYQTLLQILAPSSTCNLPPIVYQSDAQSSSPLLADVTLLPQTRYTVQVVAGATGSEREVYSFSFTTGRYVDFASQIAVARAVGPILSTATAPGAASVPTTYHSSNLHGRRR